MIVGDIDRGGVFAALYGTLAALDPRIRRLIAGFVINKFRGDQRLLAPGLDTLRTLTGRPTLGVLPWQRDLWLDAEDSLDLDSRPRTSLPPLADESLRIAVVRLPRLSNVTDVDPLAAEPGVIVTLVTEAAHLIDADLVILPGTRATVSDLGWLRSTGMADAIMARAAAGRPVLGICGGHQMLADTIDDEVESRAGSVVGSRLASDTRPLRHREDPRPSVRRSIRRAGGRIRDPPRGRDGPRRRRRSSTVVSSAQSAARAGTASSRTTTSAARSCATSRNALSVTSFPRPTSASPPSASADSTCSADLIDEHVDTDAVVELISNGAPADLPVITSSLG